MNDGHVPATRGLETATVLRKTLRLLVIATVLLYLAVFGTGYYVYTIAQSNTKGLCALRTDAESRVDQSKQFLKEHPQGIPGISAEQLKRSTDNSKRTIAALESVRCPPPPDLNVPEKTAAWLGF